MTKIKLFGFLSLLVILALIFAPAGGALAAGSPQDGQPPQPANGNLKIYLPITVGGNENYVPPTATATLPPGVTPTATATLTPPPGITPTAVPTQPPTPPPPPPGSVVSDDFNYWPGVKSGVWGVQAPSDSLVRVDGSHLRLYVPGGSAHHPWRDNANSTARAYQSLSGNQDFEVAAKFESRPGADSSFNAIQGILVEQDANNFLRFEFTNVNSSLIIYTSRIQGGTQTQLGSTRTVTPAEVPGIEMHLKLTRAGNGLTFAFSANGSSWLPLHTGDLNGMTVNKVGLYGGNSGIAPKAYEAAVDYFFNTAAPISPEDPIDPSFLFSDDFSGGSLNPIWTFTKRLASPSLSFTGTQARLDFPADLEHDIWDSAANELHAPRLMQKTNNRNFEVEVKFDSLPQGTYTSQGLLVMEDDQNFLQYYYYSFEAKLRLYASFVIGGVEETSLVDADVPPANVSTAPMWLRINRSGSFWVLTYSQDGVTWHNATVFAVSKTMVTNEVGVIAGTEDHGGTGPIPAFTALVDFFQNTSMPLSAHD